MNIYRRKDKQNHKETKKYINMQTNEKIVTQSAKKLVKQTAIHSSCYRSATRPLSYFPIIRSEIGRRSFTIRLEYRGRSGQQLT